MPLNLITDKNEKNEKDPEDPSTTSLEYDAMTPAWQKMEALLGGTEAMRLAGEQFLPMHTEEEQGTYQERLTRNTLFNMTKITLNDLVGKPFSEAVKINDDVPSQIVEWLEDIDLQGNNIDVFARNWFRSGVAKAYSHVLVDFPKIKKENEDGSTRTLDQDVKENVRPYWVNVPPENLIYARASVQNGKEILEEIRIVEVVIQQVGFVQVFTKRIRRMLPGIVEFYVPTKRKKNGKTVWALDEEFTYDLDFIPLVTFYTDRDTFMTGDPPLIDLADLNIQHWQSSSDQTAALTVARFPILALSGGAPDEGRVIIGPRKWLHTPDSQGKYYYVENEGKALEAGRTDLLDIENRMSSFGAEFLKKKPGNITATARALDSAEATSPLQDMTIRFMDAVNLALDFTAQWGKLDEGGSVTIGTDFGIDDTSDAKLDTVNKARENRDISRKAYLTELQLRDVLSEEFDMVKDAQQLKREDMDEDGGSNDDLDPQGGRTETEKSEQESKELGIEIEDTEE